MIICPCDKWLSQQLVKSNKVKRINIIGFNNSIESYISRLNTIVFSNGIWSTRRKVWKFIGFCNSIGNKRTGFLIRSIILYYIIIKLTKKSLL